MYYKDNTTRSERVGQMIIKLWDGLSGYIEGGIATVEEKRKRLFIMLSSSTLVI